MKILPILSKRKMCGEVYGAFGNGICYKYVKGEAMEHEKAGDPHFNKLIIEKLVSLHCIPHNHCEDHISIFDKIRNMLHHIPKSYSNSTTQSTFTALDFPKPSYFESEIEFLRTALTSSESASPQVLCHNDFYYCNILYDEETDQVRFVDFEYGLNYQAYDIGNHFNACGVGDMDPSRFPNKDAQMEWLGYYLRCWNRAHGMDGKEIEKGELERMYWAVDRFSLVAHLFWMMWCFDQAESSRTAFDYLAYAKKRLNECQKRRYFPF